MRAPPIPGCLRGCRESAACRIIRTPPSLKLRRAQRHSPGEVFAEPVRMITSTQRCSRVLAVAVLVLLATSAGAILVAADLAPACGILGIAVGGGRLRHQ